ncbi:MAG: hypothetical protein MZV70_18705 [Desulfobacterales bacterium]|nr:hypothetical protein [Desulfobacterales bacterium]
MVPDASVLERPADRHSVTWCITIGIAQGKALQLRFRDPGCPAYESFSSTL